ncbi:MAG: LysR family transcriptional regulator [Geminicoccaceae bacterium]
MNKAERLFTDSNLLRSFVEITDCGNLTLAASRLARSQSAISVQIRKLEMELKTSLFVRDGKGMSLSANGEKLLPAVRRVLSELAKLKPLFETPLNGRIRVGIPDDFDEGVPERTLADFARTNPGAEALATSGCTAVFPNAIRKGDLDIAVYSAPEGIPGKTFLEQKPVWVASETMYPLPQIQFPLHSSIMAAGWVNCQNRHWSSRGVPTTSPSNVVG